MHWWHLLGSIMQVTGLLWPDTTLTMARHHRSRYYFPVVRAIATLYLAYMCQLPRHVSPAQQTSSESLRTTALHEMVQSSYLACNDLLRSRKPWGICDKRSLFSLSLLLRLRTGTGGRLRRIHISLLGGRSVFWATNSTSLSSLLAHKSMIPSPLPSSRCC